MESTAGGDKGYFAGSEYTVVNIRVKEEDSQVPGVRLDQIASTLNSHLRCNYNGILCCAQEKQILMVLCDYSFEMCQETVGRIFDKLCSMTHRNEQVFTWM